jgi:hypothetical protein
MKKLRAILIAASILFCLGLSAYALDSPKVAKAKYNVLAAKVRTGDTSVDWQELRLAAEVGSVEGNYDLLEANTRGNKAFNEGKFDDSLKIANEMLAHNIASGDAHFLAYISLKHMGRQADADKERALLDAFFQSIMKSGDGKSAATAWFTVNVHEEYLVIRLLLKMNVKSQSLSSQNGHEYDEMTVTDDSGKETTLWFNTDTDMQMMADEIDGSKKKN